jgi:hypothetical protein
MNITVTRIITITAAIALTSLGSVSVAQAKQGADDASSPTQSVVDDRGLHAGQGADDVVPHVSGADDTTPHVSGADDTTPHVSGADDTTSHRRHTGHAHGSHHHGAAHRVAQHA